MNQSDDPYTRLSWHLDNWARWMRSMGMKELRLPSGAAGCVGGGYSNSFDDMCQAADRTAAAIMDAMIESLPASQQAAVHHRWLSAVYRFPRGNYPEVLQSAYDRLSAGMAGRGLV